MKETEVLRELGVEALTRVENLAEQEAAIILRLDSGELVDDKVAAQFLNAQKVIEATRSEVLGDSRNIAAIVHVGTTAITALQQLESLRGILDEGAIESAGSEYLDQLSKVREVFDSYEDYIDYSEEADRFMETSRNLGHISVAYAEIFEPLELEDLDVPQGPEDVEEAYVEEPKNKIIEQPETETSRKPLQVTFTDKVLRIGERGRIINFRSEKAEEGKARDYSEQNRNALKHLINNPGVEFTTSQLWAVMHPDGKEYSGRYAGRMKATREWLLNLTYRNQRIVGWSGKRGRGSFYWLSPNFDVSLIEREKHIQPVADKKSPETKALTPASNGLVAAAEGKRANKELIPGITLGDFYVLANKLNGFSHVMKAYLKPVLDKSLLEDLKVYAPDLTHLKGDCAAIEKYGRDTLSRIETVFQDEDALLELIDVLDEDSPEAKFVEYIYSQLEGPEDRDFIRSLISAKVVHEISTYSKMPMDIKSIVVDKDGEIIWPIKLGGRMVKQLPRPSKRTDETAGEVPELPRVAKQDESDPPAEAKVNEATASQIEQSPETQELKNTSKPERKELFVRTVEGKEVKIYEDERESARRRAKFDDALERAEHTAARFLEHFAPDAVVRSSQLRAVMGNFRIVLKNMDSEESYGLFDVILEDLKRQKRTSALFDGSKANVRAFEQAVQRRVNRLLEDK